MAGDYIAMDHELPGKPEVAAIMEATGAAVDVICGRLFLLWSWFDRHTTDGFLPGTGFHALAVRCGGDRAFWEAVASTGWLSVSSDGARLPNFTDRFGETARERMKGAARVAKHRKAREGRRGLLVTADEALHERYTSVTEPLPKRSPEPEPEPEPVSVKTGTGSGAFSKLEEADLRDDDRLMAWARRAAGCARPVVANTDRDLLFVFSAAERALEVGKTPARLFASIVGKGRRDVISQAQEDRGLDRLRRCRSAPVASGITPTFGRLEG